MAASELSPPAARQLVTVILADLPRRLAHSLAVGESAERIAACAHVRKSTRDLMVAAAYVHDVGYAPALRRTGFHPLDGALYLRERGWEAIARLVAYHSQAKVKARLKGLDLSAFSPKPGISQDVVDYADARTGPDASVVTVEERLAGIAARHAGDPTDLRDLEVRRPLMLALARRVERRCGGDPFAASGSC
jgi:hypothetical protein